MREGREEEEGLTSVLRNDHEDSLLRVDGLEALLDLVGVGRCVSRDQESQKASAESLAFFSDESEMNAQAKKFPQTAPVRIPSPTNPVCDGLLEKRQVGQTRVAGRRKRRAKGTHSWPIPPPESSVTWFLLKCRRVMTERRRAGVRRSSAPVGWEEREGRHTPLYSSFSKSLGFRIATPLRQSMAMSFWSLRMCFVAVSRGRRTGNGRVRWSESRWTDISPSSCKGRDGTQTLTGHGARMREVMEEGER